MKIILSIALLAFSVHAFSQSDIDTTKCSEAYKVLLESTTNYVLKFEVIRRVKRGRCDCFEDFSKCYLYAMKIDSILFLENTNPHTFDELKSLIFFSSTYSYLKEGQEIIGLFRNSYTKDFIYLERILPTKSAEKLCFGKEYLSIAGPLECLDQKVFPFNKFFKKKKNGSGVPPWE